MTTTTSNKSNKYFDPETLKLISRLDLRARQVVEGFLSGQHKSRHFGNSVEFRQHRQYTPGDDLRHIDWKVWGRQDRLYVKQYEVDTHLRLTLLLDISASMHYASRAMSKYDYACTLACSLAFLAMRQQDAVGAVMLNQDVTVSLPHKTQQLHLTAIAETMQQHAETKNAQAKTFIDWTTSLAEKFDKTYDKKSAEVTATFGDAFRRTAETIPPFGLVVLLSDLLIAPEELERGLRLLRASRHDVMVLQVLDDDELEFPFSGSVQFEGLDVPLRLRCDARTLRRGYLEALESHQNEVRRICSENQVDYALFRTSDAVDAPLAAYLNRRATIIRNRV